MLHIKALLFDMDGTLVDSTAVVENEWRRFSTRYHLNAEKVISFAHGRQTLDTVVHFIGAGEEAIATADELDARELVILDGIVALPGAANLLNSLPSKRWALVTSASRELATKRMAAAGLPLPSVMVCAEDVVHGKPSPEGYLKAASTLGFSAAECLVFEDADAGIRAGNASGARVIAVVPDVDATCSVFACTPLDMLTVIPNEHGLLVRF